ncbi:uncharacterized protein B0H18DRAFT_1020 [Fomitopsis serialis]|uniref:uncharacterized protein n=1 Tax=Fomitopsis serialis TaxID=139415 RepID=UPI0020081C15|nr:uncharacterized protein B0H18DRAFT_1020 [Neoantrodia serialis]KAH9938032.1 hypothetical protein B0H18DRAFT_1020 [Neoantrodia serialis]
MGLFCAKCPKYATKRCKGCQVSSANYCSKDCQEQDWPEHKFECESKASIEIGTADRLVRAAHRRRLPHDMATLSEWGFVRAAMDNSIHELLDFWVEFIVSLEIPSRSLRNWRRDQVLCQIIELGYQKSGRASKSQAFKWFKEHRWIIDPSLGAPPNIRQGPADASTRFQRWIGLPAAAFQNIDAVRSTWPESKRTCYDMSELVFNHFAILPPTTLWIDFGFCVCRNDREEKKLEDIYRRLLELHTFEEFWTAYGNGTLISLMDPLLSAFEWRKRAELLDVFQNPTPSSDSKSVWVLKGAILADGTGSIMREPSHPVSVEYGFCNARSVDDVKELKRLYMRLFLDVNVRPLKLHEVAVADGLYGFANNVLGFGKEEKEVFGRLLGR